MSFQQEKFKEIADKIREYTDTSESIAPKNFALKIDDVAMVQFQKGKAEGGGGETLPDADVMEFPLEDGSIGRVSTDSWYYNEIAKTIQNCTSDHDKFWQPSDLAAGVDEVYDSGLRHGEDIGYGQGYIKGEAQGYVKGLEEGEAQGRQEQNKEFWEQLLAPMNRGMNCPNFFCGTGWNTYTFFPTKDIRPIGTGANMFNYFSQHVTPYMDMAQRLEECGVTLDTSGVTISTLMFAYCYVTSLPKLNFTGVTGLDRTFLNSSALVTIVEVQLRGQEEIEAGMALNTFGSGVNIAFGGCTGLTNITFTGIIGNSISFTNSTKLTKKSILGTDVTLLESNIPTTNLLTLNGITYYGGIFGALAGTDRNVTGKTLTLSLTAVNKAFETSEDAKDGSTSDEWETLTGMFPNWTISLMA